MNSIQQDIAIATACGWTALNYPDNLDLLPHGYAPNVEQIPRNYKYIPSYTNNLNAMHEAEKVLTPDQFRKYIDYHLPEVMQKQKPYWHCDGSPRPATSTCATAAQRAEAFLRTLNLWKD